MRPLGPYRPAYTPWGYCDRLGWSVVTCGCHPQPSRRPRALKVAAAGSGQRRRGGVLRVTRVTTTGTRGVGRDPAAAVFFLAKKKEGAWTPVTKSNNFFFILVLRQAPQAPVIIKIYNKIYYM